MATTMERPATTPVHPQPRRRAPWPVEFYRSAVGKKWVMALTGIILILGEPVREFTALSFWLKMGLIAAAVTSTIVFARTVRPAHEAADREFTAATKAAVVAALLVWMAIVFLGRAIAYDVAVWGSLSPSA